MTIIEDRPGTTGPQPGPSPAGVERPNRSGGELWWALTGAIAIAALLFAFVAMFFPSDNGGPAAADTAAAGAVQRFEIELGDLYVSPNTLEVEAGRPVVLVVTNASATLQHDLKLNGTVGTAMLDPGATEEVDIGVVTDGAQAWCTVPGHRAAGMEMTFVVAGGATGGAAAAGAQHATGGTDAAADTAAFATIDPQAAPAADWKPYDPALKPAPGGTEHEIALSATEVVMEVAPGVTQQLWTFNNQFPGPVLRGNVGDVFTVTLTNDGTLGHSIDFHASQVAWSDEMRTIAPGESLVYQFEAEYAGMWMYHCGTAPALHHIGNGMFGAIIIDPPNLPAVDHEFVFVQSELYLGPEGQPGDLTKMLDDAWDAVMFNGYFNQYMHAPIRVEAGDRVRAWVLDAGPSENSSFHVVGTIFDTVYMEGHYTLQPSDEQGGSQALGLQPAQGGFVEFEIPEEGFYPIVTHKFSNASNGAMGLFQAGDVELAAGASH